MLYWLEGMKNVIIGFFLMNFTLPIDLKIGFYFEYYHYTQ